MTKIKFHHDGNAPLPRLSDELHRLSNVCNKEELTLSQLIKALRSRGHALITLFMAVPFLLPIPMPGLSIVLGVVILLCGVRIAFQLRPWIPRRWRKRRISGAVLVNIFRKAERLMRKLEKFIRPRAIDFAGHPHTIRACGWMIAICGLLLSLPYPPGTNAPPASAIVLLSVGVLEEDSLFIGLGIADFIFNLVFFTAITFWGVEAVKWLVKWFY